MAGPAPLSIDELADQTLSQVKGGGAKPAAPQPHPAPVRPNPQPRARVDALNPVPGLNLQTVPPRVHTIRGEYAYTGEPGRQQRHRYTHVNGQFRFADPGTGAPLASHPAGLPMGTRAPLSLAQQDQQTRQAVRGAAAATPPTLPGGLRLTPHAQAMMLGGAPDLPPGFGPGATIPQQLEAVFQIAPQQVDSAAHAVANVVGKHIHDRQIAGLGHDVAGALSAGTDFHHQVPMRGVQETLGVKPGQPGLKAGAARTVDHMLDWLFAPSNAIYGPLMEGTVEPILGPIVKKGLKAATEHGGAFVAEHAPGLARAGERVGGYLNIGEKAGKAKSVARTLVETKTRLQQETQKLATAIKNHVKEGRLANPAYDAAEQAFQRAHPGHSRLQELVKIYAQDPGMALRRAGEEGMDKSVVEHFGKLAAGQAESVITEMGKRGLLPKEHEGGAHFRPGSPERRQFVESYINRMFGHPVSPTEPAAAVRPSAPHPATPRPAVAPAPAPPAPAQRVPGWMQAQPLPETPGPAAPVAAPEVAPAPLPVTEPAPAPPAVPEKPPWQARAEQRAAPPPPPVESKPVTPPAAAATVEPVKPAKATPKKTAGRAVAPVQEPVAKTAGVSRKAVAEMQKRPNAWLDQQPRLSPAEREARAEEIDALRKLYAVDPEQATMRAGTRKIPLADIVEPAPAAGRSAAPVQEATPPAPAVGKGKAKKPAIKAVETPAAPPAAAARPAPIKAGQVAAIGSEKDLENLRQTYKIDPRRAERMAERRGIPLEQLQPPATPEKVTPRVYGSPFKHPENQKIGSGEWLKANETPPAQVPENVQQRIGQLYTTDKEAARKLAKRYGVNEATVAGWANAPVPVEVPKKATVGERLQGMAQRRKEAEGIFGKPPEGVKPVEPVKPVESVKPVEPVKRPTVGTGRETTVRAGETPVKTQWAVRDVNDVITSHTDTLAENQRYPQELQPRDRTRMASREQITALERRLDPELMAENPLAQHGAPIVGPDGAVESGNARTIALRRAYGTGGEVAENYRSWLKENAGRFGIKPEEVAGVKNPVLVRVRTETMTPEERVAFTRNANARETAAMGAAEQAKVDSEKLVPLMSHFNPGADGNLNAASNRGFIQEFVRSLPEAEQAGLRTADGSLSQDGLRRLQNAVFAHAYNDTGVIARMAEATDDATKNITNGLLRAAGFVSELKGKIAAGNALPVDIAPDLMAAAKQLGALRERGENVADYLAQQEMLGGTLDPFQKDVLRQLYDNRRSGKKIAALIADYTDLAEKAGNPSTASLFEEIAPPTKEEIWSAAKQRVQEIHTHEPSLFAETTEAGQTTGSPVAEKTAPRPPAQATAPPKGEVKPPKGFHKGAIKLFASTEDRQAAEQAVREGAAPNQAAVMAVSEQAGSKEGYRALETISKQAGLDAAAASGLVEDLPKGAKPKPGWVAVPDEPRYGELAGKQVPETMGRVLRWVAETPLGREETDDLMGVGRKYYDAFVRNARLGMLHPLANPVGLVTSMGARALQMELGMQEGLQKALRGKPWAEKLGRGFVSGPEGIGRLTPAALSSVPEMFRWWGKGEETEAMQALDRYFPTWRTTFEPASRTEERAANLAAGGTIHTIAGKRVYVPPDWLKQFKESGAVSHGMMDQWAKYSLFKALRGRVGDEEAAKIVKAVLFDYSDTNATLEWANRKGLWVFNAVPTKQAGLAIRTLVQRPWLLARYPRLRAALFAEQPGSQEQYESLPDYRKGAFVLPAGKDEKGQQRFVNLGRWMPFTGFFDALSGGAAGGNEKRTLADRVMSVPLWGPALTVLLAGRDPRTGNDVTPAGAPPWQPTKDRWEKIKEMSAPTTVRAFGFPALAPGVGMSGSIGRAQRGETSSPSPYAAPQTLREAWSQFLGVPTYTGNDPDRQRVVQRMADRVERGGDFLQDVVGGYKEGKSPNPYRNRYGLEQANDMRALARQMKETGKYLVTQLKAARNYNGKNELTDEGRQRLQNAYLWQMALQERLEELNAKQ